MLNSIVTHEQTSRNYDLLTDDEISDFNAWIDDCKADTPDPEPADLIPFDSESDNPDNLAKAGWTRMREIPCVHMVEQFGSRADFQCADCFAKSKGFLNTAHLTAVSDGLLKASLITLRYYGGAK